MIFQALVQYIQQMGLCYKIFNTIDSKLAAGGELPEIQKVERTKEQSLEFNYVAGVPDAISLTEKVQILL